MFYVYSATTCGGDNEYLKQVRYNSKVIKQMDSTANIALVTNCNITVSLAQYLSVVVPIHSYDLVNTTEKQWRTRVLYNAYLPFHYSFIIDSHVFPCDKLAIQQLLTLFEESQVDISFSNRMNIKGKVSGGAVLSRWSDGSFTFWKRCYNRMVSRKYVDDQGPMGKIMNSKWSRKYKFRWLSSNWFFASNGISKNGDFSGVSKCYRSSVIVTGPIRWVHGDMNDCKIMNGVNRGYELLPRCYFKSGSCKTNGQGVFPIFSESEFQKVVNPVQIPQLLWNSVASRNSTSLYW